MGPKSANLAGMHEQIGPYRVREEVGRGGMGVVYRAHDERLGRDVAIKALPDGLAGDAFRLERFEMEAKTLAALNHPNLAGIHGLEEQGGKKYLILEYVGGETLADRLERGPMPPDEAVEIAVQIAEGLEAAHDAGIIHRDLKPANVKVTEDGTVKVLDFGLARVDDGQNSSSVSQMPTEGGFTNSPTIPGAILGTAAYMSPEQARGRRIDKRTDIWSFGVLLYELMVGVSPFVGETAGDSIGAVLHKEVSLAGLPDSVPRRVRRVLSRCLEREKSQRYRDIGDVRLDLLTKVEDEPEARGAVVESKGVPAGAAVAVALVLAGAMGAAGWFASRAASPEPERLVRKLEIMKTDADSEFDPNTAQISPDGMKIAFIDGDALCVRNLSTFGVMQVAEVENPTALAWSPDGRSIAFGTTREMFKVPATGGGVTKLGDYGVARQFAWTEHDRIIFTDVSDDDNQAIMEMSANGAEPRVLVEADEDEMVDYHAIASIPGTDVLLFVRHLNDQRTPVMAWDGTRTVVLADFEDQYVSTLAWSPSGHVLFTRGFGDVDLWAVPFSPERMEARGDPFLVQPQAFGPSVSREGTLAIARGKLESGGELVWVLPDGTIETIGDGGEMVSTTLVSPDGTRVAFGGGTGPQDMQVWVRDLERGINTRISSVEGFVFPSGWSPDSREIAVMNFDPAVREDGRKTHFLAADGSGPTRESYPGLLSSFDADWKTAALVSDPRSDPVTISALDLADRSVIGEVTRPKGSFLSASVSPDGTLLLFGSRESGESQVYCTRFPSGEGRWQVSSEGGSQPVWSGDGSTVYYTSTDRELIHVKLFREPEIRFGLPEPVFETMPDISEYDAIRPAPDGERFISTRGRDADEEKTGFSLSIVEHWAEEFREKD